MWRRNLQFKRPWMVINALIVSSFLAFNPVYAQAYDYEDLEDEIDEDEIWAQIDKDELRSSIDVDELRDNIDRDELSDSIDDEDLEAQINIDELKENIDEETLKAEIDELKENDGLAIVLEGYKERFPDVIVDDILLHKDELFPIEEHPVDVNNVLLPMMANEHILNYYVDPMGLIYLTDAAKYGGGKVEENAHILFMNSEGDYKFSGSSDKFKVINKSNIPVKLIVKVTVDEACDIKLVDSEAELYGNSTSMYFGLADDEGLTYVDPEQRELKTEIELDAAPDNTYEYTFNEVEQKYEYVEKDSVDEEVFDAYSFCIKADCNPEADWSDIYDIPNISVSWMIEPVFTDWDKVNNQLEEYDKAECELVKSYKLEELKEKKLSELHEEALDKLYKEKLEDLIDKKVDKLAKEEFERLKEERLQELIDEYEDAEDDSFDEEDDFFDDSDDYNQADSSDNSDSHSNEDTSSDNISDASMADSAADNSGSEESAQSNDNVEETASDESSGNESDNSSEQASGNASDNSSEQASEDTQSEEQSPQTEEIISAETAGDESITDESSVADNNGENFSETGEELTDSVSEEQGE